MLKNFDLCYSQFDSHLLIGGIELALHSSISVFGSTNMGMTIMTNETSTNSSNGDPQRDEMISLTADIVAAYVSNNAVSSSDLPGLIETVFSTLQRVGAPAAPPEPEQQPAVPVKRSISNKAIVCLECGKGQKMLKRHLASAHGLTPDEYRAKWRLPYDYPMVAPDYAEKRRTLAKQIGLGRKPAASQPKRKSRR